MLVFFHGRSAAAARRVVGEEEAGEFFIPKSPLYFLGKNNERWVVMGVNKSFK